MLPSRHTRITSPLAKKEGARVAVSTIIVDLVLPALHLILSLRSKLLLRPARHSMCKEIETLFVSEESEIGNLPKDVKTVVYICTRFTSVLHEMDNNYDQEAGRG